MIIELHVSSSVAAISSRSYCWFIGKLVWQTLRYCVWESKSHGLLGSHSQSTVFFAVDVDVSNRFLDNLWIWQWLSLLKDHQAWHRFCLLFPHCIFCICCNNNEKKITDTCYGRFFLTSHVDLRITIQLVWPYVRDRSLQNKLLDLRLTALDVPFLGLLQPTAFLDNPRTLQAQPTSNVLRLRAIRSWESSIHLSSKPSLGIHDTHPCINNLPQQLGHIQSKMQV